MFCKNCGKEISNDAVICIYCGCATGKEVANSDHNEPKTGMGILLGLLLGLLGLIIGLVMYPANTVARKTFLKAWGITFGSLCAFVVVMYILIVAIAVAAVA